MSPRLSDADLLIIPSERRTLGIVGVLHITRHQLVLHLSVYSPISSFMSPTPSTISDVRLRIAVLVTLQSNLDYPDLDYPDFSIIRTFSLVPFFFMNINKL